MILYNTRTQKLPLSTDFYTNNANALKMFRYNETLMSNCGDYRIQEQVTSDVYYTYNALVTFNNTLDKNVINAFTSLDKFIQEHEEIKESKDSRCKSYYDKMIYWNNKYKTESSDTTIQAIQSDVQDLMRFLAKQEIVKESGCNLKRNYF